MQLLILKRKCYMIYQIKSVGDTSNSCVMCNSNAPSSRRSYSVYCMEQSIRDESISLKPVIYTIYVTGYTHLFSSFPLSHSSIAAWIGITKLYIISCYASSHRLGWCVIIKFC